MIGYLSRINLQRHWGLSLFKYVHMCYHSKQLYALHMEVNLVVSTFYLAVQIHFFLLKRTLPGSLCLECTSHVSTFSATNLITWFTNCLLVLNVLIMICGFICNLGNSSISSQLVKEKNDR